MKKGMIITNLPEHCRDCDFYGIKCRITGEMCKYYSENGRPESCPIREIPDYEDLEEQNKLLRLPCAAGDTVWDIDFGRPCSYEVTGFSFGSLNDDFGEENVLDQVIVYYTNSNGSITGSFAVSEIGKSVFLSSEEAEATLEELERGRKE